jgi:CRP/FNR family transcriptional regulator, cyclic AMP receptor protein
MIQEDLLIKYGAILIHLKKEDTLFYEKDEANNYFQVVSGSIKMVNFSYDGQEFIQGVFGEGESFGEPPLFGGFPYPSNAVALNESSLLKLRKDQFFQLIKDNFDIHLQFSAVLSKRLAYKSMILREISSYAPEHRIMTLVKYLKANSSEPRAKEFIVPYTRQQIADMTGLRVETVIRAVKKLEDENKLKIVKHKIVLT